MLSFNDFTKSLYRSITSVVSSVICTSVPISYGPYVLKTKYSTKSKATDERNEAKTTLDRLQEEFEINKQKLEERQKELDLAKSNNVTLENQIETLTNEVRHSSSICSYFYRQNVLK